MKRVTTKELLERLDGLQADVDGIQGDVTSLESRAASWPTRADEAALADSERRLWRLELRPVRCACTACLHTPTVGVA
mgnify:CR=1 FL=1